MATIGVLHPGEMGAALAAGLVATGGDVGWAGDGRSAATRARAESIGLCNKVVPGAELQATAKEWAERLAAGPTKSFMFSKWLINRSLDVDRRTIIEEEAWAVELVTHTEDSKEGVASFVERRAPQWKGY